ncbi:hypothetical protein [Tenuibacillus multivorans]|uniref:Uncharacterized protein n=1 Tax=Tenuibacillus multivorans TaxID=237069 RepID=A0A1G9XS51_9BACI|nr:hypothetical protein [Tenuibacillus multivorans]GEL75773.1 hypothetical protein TMU01_00080 [Tenuibacillus multivorans]SDM98995.1 hypothetical protein SAMN05216498_1067 [Tenuibacillus multivorans]
MEDKGIAFLDEPYYVKTIYGDEVKVIGQIREDNYIINTSQNYKPKFNKQFYDEYARILINAAMRGDLQYEK